MDRRGPYKTQAIETLKARGVPVGTVLDVGVQRGTRELLTAFPDVPHLLFEPVAEFAPHIAAAYAKVPHELLQVAVSDQSGSVALRTARKLGTAEITHSTMVFDPAAQGEIREVPMATLDSLLAGRDLAKPYLLKIDIDGHEMRALAGAAQTLRDCSVVIVECVYNTLTERVGRVQAAGFRLFDLCEPCYYDKVLWQCDAVFLRNDLHARFFQTGTGGSFRFDLYEAFG